MGEVINFNQARKRRQREQAEKRAAENRVRFGRTKAQKEHEAAALEEERRRLDQLRIEKPPPEE